MQKFKHALKSRPVKSTPQKYERFLKALQRELLDTPLKDLVGDLPEDTDPAYKAGFYAGVSALIDVVIG